MHPKNPCIANIANLLACKSVAQAFGENIYELKHLRGGWSVGYANDLKEKIQQVQNDYYSGGLSKLDASKMEAWRELMFAALTDLAVIRASVKIDFKSDKPFLKDFFDQTGYSNHFSDAKNGDHFSMFRLIDEFVKGLSPEWEEKIIAGGLDKRLVRRVKAYSKQLSQFTECFEIMADPSLADEGGRQALNEVYAEMQDICRMTTAYYFLDPAKRGLFNFFSALRRL